MNGTRAVHRFGRIGAGSCMIVGPSLLVLSTSTHPRVVPDETEQLAIAAQDPARWAITHGGVTVATLMMVAALLGLAFVLRARRPLMALCASVLIVAGYSLLIGYMALHGFAEWQAAAAGDPAEMAALMERIFGSAGVAIPFVFLPTVALGGTLLLVVGLHRSGLAPAWMGVLLMAGGSMSGLGTTALLGSTLLFVLGPIVQLIALAPYGIRLLGWSDEQLARPPDYASPFARLLQPRGT